MYDIFAAIQELPAALAGMRSARMAISYVSIESHAHADTPQGRL
jgi:hypothetical protein